MARTPIQLYKISLLTLLILSCHSLFGQWKQNDKNLLQLSGIVSSKKIGSVPFASVRIKNSYRGTIAAFDGFYSIVVKEHDTVEYSAVGFKKTYFIVSVSSKDQKFIYNPVLQSDTITFKGPVIGPKYSFEQFRTAFLNLRVTDTYADNARKNLDPEVLAQLYETLAHDGGENQQIAMQQIANAYYYSGYQTNYNMMGNNNVPVPASLTNPFAWAQFFQALKEGKFKKKDAPKPTHDFE